MSTESNNITDGTKLLNGSEGKYLQQLTQMFREAGTLCLLSEDQLWTYLSGDAVDIAREGGQKFIELLSEDVSIRSDLTDEIRAYLLFLKGLALQGSGHWQEAKKVWAIAIKMDSSIEHYIEWYGFEEDAE